MNKMPNIILSENINRLYERSKSFEYHCTIPKKIPEIHETNLSISSDLSEHSLIPKKEEPESKNDLDPETRKIINLIIKARANIKKNNVKISVALLLSIIAIVLIIISWMVHDT